MTRCPEPCRTGIFLLPMRFFVVFFTCLFLSACSRPITLESIRQENVLHVMVRNAPSVYYEGREGPAGFEYELAQLLADDLGVELRIRVAENLDEMMSVLDKGYTHIAATGVAMDAKKRGRYQLSPGFLQARPVVVYREGINKPESVKDLIGRRLVVSADSHHDELLEVLRREDMDLAWEARADIETTDLLQQLEAGDADIAIVDANELALYQVFFPKIRTSFELATDAQEFAWLLPENADPALVQAIGKFFATLKANGTLAQLQERYYGHLDRMGYVGARTFVYHVRNRLPRYEQTFRKAADKHDLDWKLLAAVGYQESHWTPDAISPTGVQGLMMLTRNTAQHVGVANRLDPKASIAGGARYLAELMEWVPKSVIDEDRTWFALAAYNVGMGHVNDARALARQLGKNPDSWGDIMKVLPLLTQKQWYSKTRHGYARGHEPVIYVQNIRRYFDVIDWMNNQPDIQDEDKIVAKNKTVPEPEALYISNTDLVSSLTAMGTPSAAGITPPTL